MVQRLFKSSMVRLLVNTEFIPFMSYYALVTLLRYLATYKNVDLNDIHFKILVSSKHWPQLSNSNSLSNYLLSSRSKCILIDVGKQGKGLHEGIIYF